LRNKKVTVRLTPEELESIKTKARIAKLSISQFFVRAVLGRRIEPPVPDDIRRDIAGFGRNLNQLAYHCNVTGTPAEIEAVESLRTEAQKIISAIAELKR
jgi:hypothetical protein